MHSDVHDTRDRGGQHGIVGEGIDMYFLVAFYVC